MLILVNVAPAQVTGGEVPEINAQTFRPTVDGRRLLWLDDGAKGRKGFVGRGLLQYVDDPLVYVDTDDEVVELVRSILQLDLLAAGRVGPLRLGVDVPIYLLSNGSPEGNESGLGDLAVDGKLTLLDRAIDLALGGRVTLPTSTVATALGSPNVGYEVTGIVSGDVGPVLLAANLGTRGGPSTSLENIELNDAFLARLGAALRWSDAVDTALEFNTQVPYSAPLSNTDGSPLELLASAAIRPGKGDWVIRAGGGTGLTPGIGSPDYRLLLALGWERADEAEPPPPTPLVDVCPVEDEDLDGYLDDDGCYDPTLVTIQVIDDETGEVLEVAKATLSSRDQQVEGTAPFEQALDPGTVTIEARARGYEPGELDFEVPPGPPVVAEVRLKPEVDPVLYVRRKELDLRKSIQFETNKAVIKPESFPLLDATVETLDEYDEIRLLRIEGHTDERGDARYNLDLSKQRAAAVRRYFIEQGIDPDRLTSEGYGEDVPLDRRSVPDAWAVNRRVDFFIADWTPMPIEVYRTQLTDDMIPIDPADVPKDAILVEDEDEDDREE